MSKATNRSSAYSNVKILVSLVLSFAVVAIGYGADATWTNTSGGVFSTGANWDTGIPPAAGERAYFTTAGDYTVSFDSNVTNKVAYFGSSTGTVTLDVGNGNEYYMEDEVRVRNTGDSKLDFISGKIDLRTHLYMGDNSAYTENHVTIRNPGTELTTRIYDVQVGIHSGNNKLFVKDGAAVFPYRYIYSGYGSVTNNLVHASGANTAIGGLTGGIIVGRISNYNKLIVEDYAAAYVTNSGSITIGSETGADWNSAVVRTGALIECNNSVSVGSYGNYNSVKVSDSAILKSLQNILVGYRACNNTLEVIDGGAAIVKSHLYVGQDSMACSNSVLVSGSGSVVSNYQFDINIGNNGNYNSMLVTNGGLVSAYRNLYVGTQTGSNNELVVNGTNSVLEIKGLNNSSGPAVGSQGINNLLKLENGAIFISTNNRTLFIGKESSASNNSFVVEGGSAATNEGHIYVGDSGSWNSLMVNDAFLECDRYLYVGDEGSYNTVTIDNGGVFDVDGLIFVGNTTSSSNNTIYVSGSGSKFFNNRYDFVLGMDGSHNLAVISDGAEVNIVRDILVGQNATASNNVIRVENGTLLNNTDSSSDFIVANNGALELLGSTNVVQAYNLNIESDSTLKLIPGKTGFNPIYVHNRITFDSTTKLYVDATDFAKQGGGILTIMNYNYKTGEVLPENMTLIPEGTTVNQDDGSSITLDVPNIAGTVIIVQ